MENSNSILISDVLSHKERKLKELAFYQEQMDKLLIRLNIIRSEIKLTEDILKLIKKEEIIEILKK